MLWDNVSATYLILNPVHLERSKYLIIDYHFLLDRVAYGALVVRYVPTRLQLADIFTKRLSSSYFSFLKANLLVYSPPVQIKRV